MDYKIALDLTEYIKHEREYVPWAVALRSLAYIGTMLSSRSSHELYQVIKSLVDLDGNYFNLALLLPSLYKRCVLE